LGQVLRLRKTGLAVQEIEDPEDPSQVICEPEKLRAILSNKYRALFASDSFRIPFSVGHIVPMQHSRDIRGLRTSEL